MKKNIVVAYLLAFFLYPLGLHRQYMGRADWWVFPVIFGAAILSALGGFHLVKFVFLTTLWVACIWDLATMWRWDRDLSTEGAK